MIHQTHPFHVSQLIIVSEHDISYEEACRCFLNHLIEMATSFLKAGGLELRVVKEEDSTLQIAQMEGKVIEYLPEPSQSHIESSNRAIQNFKTNSEALFLAVHEMSKVLKDNTAEIDSILKSLEKSTDEIINGRQESERC